jgi:heptosyltransferase-2
MNNRHGGFLGSINLIQDIKKHKFDKIIIFSSSFRFYLIAKFSNVQKIYQYPLFQKNQQHITDTPRKFMKDKFNLDINEDPEIQIDNELISQSSKKFNINKDEMNILLGIGGSGPTKRIPAKTFINVIKAISEKKKCKFFLATGKNNDEQLILNEILESKYKDLCAPLDDLLIKETLPIIKNCNLSICNDSSFSHLSAALGVKTITLMADTPLIYGNYSSLMYPIIPEGEETVTHNTLGKEKISPEQILNEIKKILD